MKNKEKEASKRRIPLLSKERLGAVGLVLLLSEALLFILSWLLSATRMEGVRSLLSSEGIRWFFGSWQTIVASPLLVWLLLGLIALGSLQKSGLIRSGQNGGSQYFIFHYSLLPFRDRLALRVSLVFLAIYLVILALLTLTPHAILLSATGHLFPSAFSRSLVPVIAFGVCLVSVTFGLVSGRLRSLADILDALSSGIVHGAPLVVVYLFAVQLYASLRFVFG
ncbi:MAG: AbgT family transporter [Bacteroidales bacterium]|nr:AbgT family transporter [Bacteroidales bacterium]